MYYDCHCENCGNLDKSRVYSDGGCYKYGCKSNIYICGWLIRGRSEKAELRNMGCSNWVTNKKYKQINIWENGYFCS